MDSLPIYRSLITNVNNAVAVASKTIHAELTKTIPVPEQHSDQFLSLPEEQPLASRSPSIRDDQDDYYSLTSPPSGEQPAPPQADIVSAGLKSQQALRDKLGELSPEQLILQQPRQTILEAQFQQDPQGTLALLKARVNALEADIDQTFSNWSSRKTDARVLHSRLQQRLSTLSTALDNSFADHLTPFYQVLDAMEDYEQTFHKDSWIQKLNLAFLGVSRVVDSAFGPQLGRLLAKEELEQGDRALLDPSRVSKYNVGRFTTNANGLRALVQSLLTSTVTEHLARAQDAVIEGLTPGDLTDKQLATDQNKLLSDLARTRPEQVRQLLEYAFQQPNSEASAHSSAALAQLATNGQDPATLIRLLNQQPTLKDKITRRLQTATLNDQHQRLKQRVDSALNGQTTLSTCGIETLREQKRFCQRLADELDLWELHDNLEDYETQLDELEAIPIHKVLSSGQFRNQTVWHLDYPLTRQEVMAALNPDSGHELVEAVAALKYWMESPPATDSKEYRAKLRDLDKLLTRQQEVLLARAKALCGQDQPFERICRQIEAIEKARPPACMLAENLTLLERGKKAGYALLLDNQRPLAQKLSALRLEHQLSKQGYDFQQEVIAMLSDSFGLAKTAAQALYQKFEDLRHGRISAKEAVIELAKLMGTDAGSAMAKMLGDTLSGAAAIADISPETLRALQGNTEQAWCNVKSVLTGSSPVLSVFNEFQARVSGEVKIQYLVEALNRHSDRPTLEKLTPEQMAKVKRLVALTTLLSSGKYVPVAVDGIIKTAQGGSSPLNLIWNVGQTGLRLLASSLIDRKVNTMDGETLKITNTALDLLYQGPAQAAINQQVMARASRIMADISCGKSRLRTGINAALLYPFQVLTEGLVSAWQDWQAGKPGALGKLAWNVVRMGPIIGLPSVALASMVTLPFLSLGFGAVAVTAVPASLFLAFRYASYLAHYTGLVDIGLLAVDKARELMSNPAIDIEAYINRALTDANYRQHLHGIAANRAYAELGDQEWPGFASANPELAAGYERDFQITLAQEITNDPQALGRVQQMAATLGYLNSIDPNRVTLEELRQHLPAADLDQLPEQIDQGQIAFWVRTCQDSLATELALQLGSDQVPDNDQAVADQLTHFNRNRQRGLHLEMTEARQQRLQELTDKQEKKLLAAARRQMTERLETELKKAMESVMESRAKASSEYINGKMRKDQFNHWLETDAGIGDGIKQQLDRVLAAEMASATELHRRRLQNRFRANGINFTEEELNRVVTAAGAAGS